MFGSKRLPAVSLGAIGRVLSPRGLSALGRLLTNCSRRRVEKLGLSTRFVVPGVATDVGQVSGALDVHLLTSPSPRPPQCK